MPKRKTSKKRAFKKKITTPEIQIKKIQNERRRLMQKIESKKNQLKKTKDKAKRLRLKAEILALYSQIELGKQAEIWRSSNLKKTKKIELATKHERKQIMFQLRSVTIWLELLKPFIGTNTKKWEQYNKLLGEKNSLESRLQAIN